MKRCGQPEEYSCAKMQNSRIEKVLVDCAVLFRMSQENSSVKFSVNPVTNSVDVQLRLESPNLLKTVKKVNLALQNKPVEAENQAEHDLMVKVLSELNVGTDRVTVKKSFFTCDFCIVQFFGRNQFLTHLEGHREALIKSFISGLKVISPDVGSSNSSHEDVSCPICPKVMRTLPELKTHFKSCRDRVEEKIKEVTNLKDVDSDKNTPLNCETCGRSFKVKIGLKKHVCKGPKASGLNVRSEDLTNYPPSVINAEYRCLPCASGFTSLEAQMQHKCELELGPLDPNVEPLKCKLCKFELIFSHPNNLKLHYAYAHYQKFFETWVKVRSYPVKCIKKTCEQILSTSRELAKHYAIDHGRLYKAFMKEKAEDMTDVTRMLYPKEFSLKIESNGSIASETSMASSQSWRDNSSVEEPQHQVDKPSVSNVTAKGLMCPKCNQVVNEPFNAHLCDHYSQLILEKYAGSKNGAGWKCPFCSRTFDGRSSQKFTRHVGNVHGVINDCLYEDGIDKSKLDLGKTLRSTAMEFRCLDCNTVFPSKEMLILHECVLLAMNGDQGKPATSTRKRHAEPNHAISAIEPIIKRTNPEDIEKFLESDEDDEEGPESDKNVSEEEEEEEAAVSDKNVSEEEEEEEAAVSDKNVSEEDTEDDSIETCQGCSKQMSKRQLNAHLKTNLYCMSAMM